MRFLTKIINCINILCITVLRCSYTYLRFERFIRILRVMLHTCFPYPQNTSEKYSYYNVGFLNVCRKENTIRAEKPTTVERTVYKPSISSRSTGCDRIVDSKSSCKQPNRKSINTAVRFFRVSATCTTVIQNTTVSCNKFDTQLGIFGLAGYYPFSCPQ